VFARGRAGGVGTRASGTPRAHGLAAALGEKYVNECDLFGCHTVLVRHPPRRVRAAPEPYLVEGDEDYPRRAAPPRQQRLASAPHGYAGRPVDPGVEARLESAKAMLGVMEGSLATENETAMEAYNSTMALASEMQLIEKQTHLDRVEIRERDALLAKDDRLLAEERQRAGAARHGERIEAQRLARAEQVARTEGVQLESARARLRNSQALQAQAVAQARIFRDALERATNKLVAYKQNVGGQELKLQKEVAHDEAVAQTQIMQEEAASSSSQMSDKEVIERLTQEVRRLTKELKQRETVIQLQQQVLKVQAHEVHELEKTAHKDADAAAKTIRNVMKSAQAASAGQATKYAEEEKQGTAAIAAAHPGIDPNSIPSVFAPPSEVAAAADAAKPAEPEPMMPPAKEWRHFGDDAIAKNPNYEAPVVGKNGVVADANFAAGVEGAHGTKTPEQEAAEDETVKEADAAIIRFEKEEKKQNEAIAVAVSNPLEVPSQRKVVAREASPAQQAERERDAAAEEFANHPVIVPDPAIKTLDDFIAKAEEERQKVQLEERERVIAREVKEKELARKAKAADDAVAKITQASIPPKPVHMQPHSAETLLHDTSAAALPENATAVSMSAKSAASPAKLLLAPKKLVHPTRALSNLESGVQDLPAHLPVLKPLATSSQMGGIADAGDDAVQPGAANSLLHSKTNPGLSGTRAAAMVQKAADIALFIVAHPPALKAKRAGEKHHPKRAAYTRDVLSLEPQNAVLPPLHSASKAHDTKGKLHPKRQHSTGEVEAEAPTTTKPAATAEAPKDTIKDDLSRAAKQLQSYDFLHEQNPADDAALPKESVSKAARDRSVAQQMKALEKSEQKSRPEWESSGLRVNGAGKVVGREENLAELPADMRGGMHIGSSFEGDMKDRQVSFKDINRGAPLHAKAEHWRMTKAQQAVEQALMKEEAAAREWVAVAKKEEETEGKAAAVAAEELKRLHAEAHGTAQRAVLTARDTARLSKSQGGASAALHHTHTESHVTHGYTPHVNDHVAHGDQSASRPNTVRSGDDESLDVALARARAATSAAEAAMAVKTPTSATVALPGTSAASRPALLPHVREVSVSMASAQDSWAPAEPSSGLDWPRRGGAGADAESKGMRADEQALQKEVGGPISSSVAKGIAHDLAKLNALTKTLKEWPHSGPLFSSTHPVGAERGGLLGLRHFAQQDASIDAKAAGFVFSRTRRLAKIAQHARTHARSTNPRNIMH
jgi:hypothetical protein